MLLCSGLCLKIELGRQALKASGKAVVLPDLLDYVSWHHVLNMRKQGSFRSKFLQGLR